MHLAASFRSSNRSFLTTSTSSSRLDFPVKRLTNCTGERDLCVPLLPVPKSGATKPPDRDFGRRGGTTSTDTPRECWALCPVWAPSFSPDVLGKSGMVVAPPRDVRGDSRLRELPLCTRRRPRVDAAAVVGEARTWDDLSMAALTEDSMPASFGRSVDGIWRSSYANQNGAL
jgi:hypothetical protein